MDFDKLLDTIESQLDALEEEVRGLKKGIADAHKELDGLFYDIENLGWYTYDCAYAEEMQAKEREDEPTIERGPEEWAEIRRQEEDRKRTGRRFMSRTDVERLAEAEIKDRVARKSVVTEED